MFRSGFLSEAGAVHDQNVFLKQQLFYPNSVVFRDVDFREGIKCAARRNATHPRNGVAGLDRDVTPSSQLPADFDEMVLWTLERRLNRVLLRMICGEPSPEHFVNAFDERLHSRGISADDAPAHAPSGSEIVLRQAANCHD